MPPGTMHLGIQILEHIPELKMGSHEMKVLCANCLRRGEGYAGHRISLGPNLLWW